MSATVWAMPPDEFGAWGQWAGAAAGAVAVVVALWVAIGDVKRRERERDDQKAAQARTITARVERRLEDRFDSAGTFLSMEQLDVVLVENHGTLPVTDVVFYYVVTDLDGTEYTPGWPNVAGVERAGDVGFLLCAVLKGGGQYRSPDLNLDDYSDSEIHDIGVDFSFVDAEGLRWRRLKNEKPIRVLDPQGAVERGAKGWRWRLPRKRKS